MEGKGLLKKLGIAAGMTLFGVIFALILMEGVFTYVIPQPDDFYHYEPYTGWTHIPGKHGNWVDKEFSVKIRINSEGFRDDEWNDGREEFRIAVIGDSYTEGFQVPFEQTVSEVLENRLNSESGKKFEVMNFGVAGYSTSQEYFVLKNNVMKYNPELVILLFSSNDVRFNSPDLSEDNFRPYFDLNDEELVQVKSPAEQPHASLKSILRRLLPKTYHFLSVTAVENPATKSILIRLGIMSECNSTASDGKIPVDFIVYSQEYNSDWNKAWNITEKLILEMKLETERNGAEFLLVSGASREQVHADWWEETLNAYTDMKKIEWDLDKPNKILESFSAENGINYVNLLPAFREYAEKNGQRLFYHYDGHWNELGHRIAAQKIYDMIEIR